MKKLKLLGIAFMFSSCLFLTGCGNEKILTCTDTQKQNGLSMIQTAKITFKHEKVAKVRMAVDSKATIKISDDDWNSFAEILDDEFDMKSTDGIKVTKDNNAKKRLYSIAVDIDLAKASDNDLSEFGLDGITDSGDSYEDVKKDIEKSGFVCE